MFEDLDLKIADAKGEASPSMYTLPSYPNPCRTTNLTQSSCGGTTLRFCC
jgi:hypothetical protein